RQVATDYVQGEGTGTADDRLAAARGCKSKSQPRSEVIPVTGIQRTQGLWRNGQVARRGCKKRGNRVRSIIDRAVVIPTHAIVKVESRTDLPTVLGIPRKIIHISLVY